MSSSLSFALRFAILLVGFTATAACAAPVTAQPSATISTAAYPLKTCVVSGGKLGGMGKPVAYVYKQAGQPDRTVMFCCKACIRKFEKEPAKYLAKIDAAQTATVGAK
jgi:YHS domain-containing protein